MTIIIDKTFRRTLDILIEDHGRADNAEAYLEAWTFDDPKARREAEARLAERGVKARIRSAYKPLVHFFLEEVSAPEDIASVAIRYPVLKGMPRRFLLESYPLAALLPDAEVTFSEGAADRFEYDVTIVRRGGTRETHTVFAPNRQHVDPIGTSVVSSTGWLRMTERSGAATCARYETDIEELFQTAIDSVASHPWGAEEPYFEELNIAVSLPGDDTSLDHGHESVSLHEALHEDLYFSLLEVFQKKSGRSLGDRGLQPGQIVPEIGKGDGNLRLVIETRPLDSADRVMPEAELERAEHAISVAQVRATLDMIGGEPLKARSRAGREVAARYIQGTDRAVVISGGQHANETSGVIGALRAAARLKDRPGAHFIISPLENPDGYALHGRLTKTHGAHMHHAARYTAFGNDLEFEPNGADGKPAFERAIRDQAEALTSAELHVNLHGYPAHEWTRPFSGYVPRTFEMWTLPKGFFLIMRHHPDWQERGEALIEAVTAHLDAIPGLRAFNEAQIALFERHAGETGFRIINGFPCLIGPETRHAAPLTLITEYPDETIEGADFIDAHTAQMETVLGAYEAYQTLAAAADQRAIA